MKCDFKNMIIIGLALFSMFFGAGNIIFPPYLGMGAGPEWVPGFICYYMADIGLSLINEAAATYPNFKAVATTLRQVKTATVNDWSAICWADGEIYKAAQYDGLEIMDRVGGGDSFASGLVYGLMTFEDAEKAVNYGAAHGALAMTTPGDTTMASLKEVEGIVGGAGARVQR